MPVRHIIIGSGIAAVAAAEAIRSADVNARITMISAEPYPFYSRPALARLLSGEVSESLLSIRSADQVEALGLERMSTHVRQIHAAAHQVTVSDGRVLDFDRLLIATGAETIPLDLPGASLKGVAQLDGVRDAGRMLELARQSRSAVVLGGGSTAVEMADGLRTRGLDTHYLMRGARYWQRVLDAEESARVERRLEESGVHVRRHVDVVQAIGVDGRLAAVETAEGERIACDLLAVSRGVRPRTQLAAAAGLMVDRGVLTDEFLETTASDIYAAGDVAQVPDAPGERASLDTLWASAEVAGRTAGRNMSGARVPHVKNPAVNVTRLAGISMTIAGAVGGASDPDLLSMTRGQSERWDAPAGARHVAGARGDDRLRLVLRDDVVIGLLAMGTEQLDRPLMRLLGRTVDSQTLQRAREAAPAEAFDLLCEGCSAALTR